MRPTKCEGVVPPCLSPRWYGVPELQFRYEAVFRRRHGRSALGHERAAESSAMFSVSRLDAFPTARSPTRA